MVVEFLGGIITDNVIGYSAPEFYIGAGVSYIQSGEAEIYFTT